MQFIIQETRKDTGLTWYVVARPGYYRQADGSQARDGSTGGPEWSTHRSHALTFPSHRAAARVRNLCPSATINPA